MPSPARRRRHTVAALAFPDLSPFELAVACEAFGIDRSALVPEWYDFFVAAVAPPPLHSGMGFTLDTPYGLDDLRRADTIVVPARFRNGDLAAETPDDLKQALRDAHDRGARLMSFCTGAFTLAAAGLLDGRPATTHWAHADELQARYPDVRVDPRVLYVDDGDVLTSAGTAAGIDLCLHVIRKDLGAEAANAIARRMVVPPHRDGGQAQYVEQPVPTTLDGDPIANVLGWLLEHLDRTVTVE